MATTMIFSQARPAHSVTYLETSAKSLIRYASSDTDFAGWLYEAIPQSWDGSGEGALDGNYVIADLLEAPHAYAAYYRAEWAAQLVRR